MCLSVHTHTLVQDNEKAMMKWVSVCVQYFAWTCGTGPACQLRVCVDNVVVTGCRRLVESELLW